MSRGYVFPIGVDDNGEKFQWVEDPNEESCDFCCFWKGTCRYFELNKGKKGQCMGNGHFRRILKR